MPLSRINNPFLSSSGADNASITSPAANTISFSTATTERMRIRSDGNTFIGVTSAVWDERLGIRTVTGTGQVGIGVYSSNTSYASSCIRVQSENGTGANWYLYEGRGQGGAVNYWVNGNGLIYTNQGIKFNGTQQASADANTLDDYEEGTWTPSVGGTATYGTRIAHYTKIGDTVRAFFDISIGTIGTGSLTTMSGFPFTCTNNDSGCISYFAGLGATVYFIQIQMSGTNCIFVGLTAAGATINNGMNVFTTGARIIGTVVYKTTT